MSEQNKLFDLLRAGVTPFMCVEECEKRLTEGGFESLDYTAAWNLVPGGKYMVNHFGTSLFAFTVGKEWKAMDMLRMAAAHTDYPCLRIKPNADFVTNGYAQVNLEVYGGPILNTWLDRPLGVAGRVALRSDNPFKPNMVLYRSEKPVMTIPNLAIHMNREVNSGVELNKQVDMMPILDMLSDEQKETKYFMAFLAKELGVEEKDIIDFELSVFLMEEPMYIGVEDTLISAPRLDNLTSCSGLVSALIDGERTNGINLIELADHEEVGSSTKQGAASTFLFDTLTRVVKELGDDENTYRKALAHSFMISADNAHAVHPNQPGIADPTNRPAINKGVVIKYNANQRYTTDAISAAVFKGLLNDLNISFQTFANRSDIMGGGTLGNISNTKVALNTVDIGLPQLAMHSAYETAGVKDTEDFIRICEAFYGMKLNKVEDDKYTVE